MILGVLNDASDKRVAVVPQVTSKIGDLGLEIFIESGAGEESGYRDEDYASHSKVMSRKDVIEMSDILVQINKPTPKELNAIPEGKFLVSSFESFVDNSIVEDLKKRGIRGFGMDMIPRTTLAQSMDILSAMASIAGYRAVILAAERLARYFPMMITAAGSVKPAKVLVIGAGVAGLQAIATARRLGAMVEAFDTRSAVREEVESLGARFVEVEGAKEDAEAGGYAVEQSEEYIRKQRELVQEKAKAANVVITTAQVRGRRAPLIVPASTVESMQWGSVIVDLAASTGGNCELTENDKTVIHNGVTIIGDSNLAQGMPQDASFLYSNNLYNFLKYIIEDDQVRTDMEDEIIGSALITG